METSRFDIADYLDSNEMIAEYLNAVLEEGDNSDVVAAIGHVAKSIGMNTNGHRSDGKKRKSFNYEIYQAEGMVHD